MIRPRFDLTDVTLQHDLLQGTEWTFLLPGTYHELGKTVIYDRISLGQASSFVTYYEEFNYLYIAKGATIDVAPGAYPITLQLIDEDGVESNPLVVSLNIYSDTVEETDEAVIELALEID